MLMVRREVMRMFRMYSLPRWMVFILDGAAILLTFFFAYLLRFNFEIDAISFGLVLKQASLVLAIYCAFELVFKSFTGLIRHTTIRDIFNVLLATTSSLAVLTAVSLASSSLGGLEYLNLPISILLIHFVSISVSLFFVRISIKMVYEFLSVPSSQKKNVLIFGAGVLGVTTKRVIESDQSNEFNIIAFLDDDRRFHGKKLNGIPVFESTKLTKEFIDKYNIKTVIFAVKNIEASDKANIFRFAVELGLEVLEVPGTYSWFNGRFQMGQLKKIDLNDLLGREPIKLNLDLIDEGLKNKTILVTGAAGSIGSEIVRQLIRFDVRKVVLVDQAETPMFNLEQELSKHVFNKAEVVMKIADVTHWEKMIAIFNEHHPDLIFHAAAYKHVPLMEVNPHEAVRVNVGGTMVMSALAIKFRVKKFVMISTDKAVNPANVMGATKRLCEKVIESRSRSVENHTQFVITRFGNVLGSNGSVIPIFRKQIEAGGPVTVTHPDITRYFMTIPEACQLVLEAGFMGKGGEIFVFDMGKPVKILDLAKQMIRLSGLEPDKDIQIEFSGLRPGEKLYEELLADKENTLPTYHSKINIAQVEKTDFMTALEVKNLLGFLYSYSNFELVEKLKDLVPEYKLYTRQHSDSLELTRTAI